jgi:hypothetical protein
LSNKYFVEIEKAPLADIVFTSVDSHGGIGLLSTYVMDQSNINSSAPTKEEMKTGYHIVRDGKRTLVFIVTVAGQKRSDHLLHGNLSKALGEIAEEVKDKSIWLPLMGTGAGGLSFPDSAEIIREIMDAHEHLGFSEIQISIPNSISKNELIGIQEIFPSNKPPSPALPLDISNQVDAFLKLFPLNELKELSLDRYSNTGNRDYFTYMVEHATAQVGGIGGGSSFKFGIFKRKDKTSKPTTKIYNYSDEYAWFTRYGANETVAFETIKNLVIKTAHLASVGQITEIADIELDTRFKWKIAFLYQNFKYPSVISLYKKEALQYLTKLNNKRFSYVEAYKLLINRKPDNIDVWSYSYKLWQKWQIWQESGQPPSKGTTEAVAIKKERIQEKTYNVTTEKYVQAKHFSETSNEEINEEERAPEFEKEVKQITAYTNDEIDTADEFKLKQEIEALASIIAFKETVPPLSIGIFGE